MIDSVRIQLLMPKSLVDKIDSYAEAIGETRSSVIRMAVVDLLNRKKGDKNE